MTFEIDGFTPLDVLGRGGFGTVHRAADDAHGREVAVKVLGRIDDDSARRRFDRERRAMGTLSGHPSIGIVYTSGFTARNEPYIVMEMIRGGSLADRLEADGPLPPSEVKELGAILAEALHHAHQGGVLHLDLKPENILMSRFGRPKIVDFGIAAIVDDDSATSTIRATPSYADPDVLDGRPGTERSDVYGLAATLYTLLEGSPPYSTGSPGMYQVMQRVALDPVPSVERPDVATGFSELLRRAMAKDPVDRPASMEEFERLLRQVDAEPATERRPARRRIDRSNESPDAAGEPSTRPDDGWVGEGERPRLPGAVDSSNPLFRPDADVPRGPSVVPVQPAPETPRSPTPAPASIPRPGGTDWTPVEPVATPAWAPSIAHQPVQTPHAGHRSAEWPQPPAATPSASASASASRASRPSGGQRTNTGAIALLATLAVVLAAVLAFVVVRRGQEDGVTAVPPADATSRETQPRELTSSEIEQRATDDGTVPDVVGLTTSDAREVVAQSGFDVEIPAHCFDTVESQTPTSGEAAGGAAVVSLRFAPCVVPDFVGLRLPEARRIVDEEFVVGLLINWPAHCDDLILGQSVEAGIVVEPGAIVDLELDDQCGG